MCNYIDMKGKLKKKISCVVMREIRNIKHT